MSQREVSVQQPHRTPVPRVSAAFATILALVVALLAGAEWSRAAPTSPQRARLAVRLWLRNDPRPLGAALSRRVRRVRTFRDEKGSPLYHVVELRPSGFVIVAGDDLVEPIIAFSADGTYDPSPATPLGALVSRDVPRRLGQVRAMAAAGPPAQQAARLAARRRKWQFRRDFQAPGGAMTTAVVSDERVPPLVASRWSQSSVAGGYCYNTYTPNHYVCGCVATAMSQMMRFFQHPTGPVGTASFAITVAGEAQQRALRGGDGEGGPYEWASMPLVPGAGISDAQRQAIGALCHDAGLSVNMMYSSSGSGAYELGGDALVNTFGYANAIEARSYGSLGDALRHMVNTNLDAGRPVVLGIFGTGGGHAIVCDGYGYDWATLYHHLNLGWAGAYDAWYNLPYIDVGIQFDSVDVCVYNVFVSGTGEIISGRVTDAQGQAVEGASLRAERGAGGVYTATTNARGIYSLERIPSASTYTLTCTAEGCSFSPRVVGTGTSRSSTASTGNVWGVDFGGPPPVEIITAALPDGRLGSAYAATVEGDGGAPPYRWTVVPAEMLGAPSPPEAGSAMGWRADDRCWVYDLPFPFPFFGTTYTSVYVCSNGYLDFADSFPDYSNTTDELKASARIAPLWDDLRTHGSAQAGEDIYIHQPDASSVAIRWVAETYSGSRPVDFAVVLHADGSIELRYGSGNAGVTPTVGISSGSQGQFVLSGHDGAASLPNAESAHFRPPHPGLSLDPDAGVLAGTPTVADTRALRFICEDSGGSRASRDLTLCVDDTPPPPLVVSVGGEPTAGEAPLTVAFTAELTGGVAPTFEWSFGDGAASTLQNPTHTYTTPGTHTAQLTVSDTGGRTATDSVAIAVAETLAVAAAASPLSGEAPLAVSFSAQAQGDAAPTFAWDFGDGATSTLQNPTHTYTEPGTWTAQVTASAAGGRTATDTVTVAAVPEFDIAATAMPGEGVAPLSVRFEAQLPGVARAAPIDFRDHTILSYGGRKYDRNAEATVSEDGTTLRIVGNGWKAIRLPCRLTPDTVLAFEFRSTSKGDIHGIGLDTNLRPSKRRIFKLYGTQRYGIAQEPAYDSDAPTWRAYEIPVGAILSGTTSILAFVNDHDVSHPDAESELRNVRLGERSACAYAWDFGDGTTSTFENPTHTYATAGTYPARVTVTDPTGRTGTSTVAIEVAPPPPLDVVASADPTTGEAPLDCQFTIQVEGQAAPEPIDFRQHSLLSYGGRRQDRDCQATVENGGATLHLAGNGWKAIRMPTTLTPHTVLAFEFRCTSEGEIHAIGFDTNLRHSRRWTMDLCGTERRRIPDERRYDTSTPVWRAYELPIGSLTARHMAYLVFINDHDTRSPTAESFFRNVRVYERSPGTTLEWDFGDGHTSTLENPIHTYAEPGTYAVQVNVGWENGREGTAALVVNALEPAAAEAPPDEGSPVPEMEVLGEGEVHFAPVAAGEGAMADGVYVVRNAGGDTLYARVSVAPPFQIVVGDAPPASECDIVLEPGQMLTLSVVFVASEPGVFEAPVVFETSDAVELRDVAATGLAPPGGL